MISLSPSCWLNLVVLAIAPLAFSLSIVPLPAPPPSQLLPAEALKSPAFMPSVAVVLGVLTTVFSITFLLLLYAKHCKRGGGGHSMYGTVAPDRRKNSGINRKVIESLPVFRFGSLRGVKDGLECAVCLNRFETNEVLRLLPKCKHGFHLECVDTWLDAHSTCPLCRYRVDPEDILLVMDPSVSSPSTSPEQNETVNFRASGRHSWAGERGSLQIILEKPGARSCNTTSFNGRMSLDTWKKCSSGNNIPGGKTNKGHRKDGLLVPDRTYHQQQRRLDHRIIISDTSGPHYRWSDVQPSDFLYLQSTLLFSESRRFSSHSTTGLMRGVRRGRDTNEQQLQMRQVAGLISSPQAPSGRPDIHLDEPAYALSQTTESICVPSFARVILMMIYDLRAVAHLVWAEQLDLLYLIQS